MNNSDKCTNLEYTMLSKYDTEFLLLQASVLPAALSFYVNKEADKWSLSYYMDYIIKNCISDYYPHTDGCIYDYLLKTPVFIDITLLPGCPPRLTLNQNVTECSCYPVLSDGFQCSINWFPPVE